MQLFKMKTTFLVMLSLVLGFFLTGCGGGGGGSSSSSSTSGTLQVSLTDASTDAYQAVYVTVARVDVHLGDGEDDDESLWETVAEPNTTYNLLELVNGVRETLGIARLEAGHYTQMRLIIGLTADSGLNILSHAHPFANYLIDEEGNEIELRVPSGPQTGLKIVNGFNINAAQTTELILDFDAMRSVVKAGNSGQYLLKPTIKVLTTVDNAIVAGTVMDVPPETDPPTDPIPLEGALVTAQTSDPGAPDVKDQVIIESGTVAEANGEYALFLTPADYNLVATQSGYFPSCFAISLLAGDTATVDFNLEPNALNPGIISGAVTIDGAPTADQYATIDFRQEVGCIDEAAVSTPTMVTVKSINVAAGVDYEVELPAGVYQVVASTNGMVTQVIDGVEVVLDAKTDQDITLDEAL